MNKVKNLSSFDAKKLIDENKDNKNFEIVDVRTKAEFKNGHIKNAKMIDIYRSDFTKVIAELDKTKTYLVYCRTGSRSRHAGEFMISLGFENVFNLQDGFLDWEFRKLN